MRTDEAPEQFKNMKLKKYRNEIQKRYPGRLNGKAIAKIYKMGITFDDAIGRLANMEKREKLKKAEQDKMAVGKDNKSNEKYSTGF